MFPTSALYDNSRNDSCLQTRINPVNNCEALKVKRELLLLVFACMQYARRNIGDVESRIALAYSIIRFET